MTRKKGKGGEYKLHFRPEIAPRGQMATWEGTPAKLFEG